MKLTNDIIGGLAGAIVLNVLQELAAHTLPAAPRLDKLGEEALTRGVEKAGGEAPKGKALFASALAGDLTANTLYYSMIGKGKDTSLLARGAGFGLAAGIGALYLTPAMGLDEKTVAKTTSTKIMTVAWYLAGGLAAALAIKALRKRGDAHPVTKTLEKWVEKAPASVRPALSAVTSK